MDKNIDDDLDGCELDFTPNPTKDEEIPKLLQRIKIRREEDAVRPGDRPEAA